jgi:hypothetical protein
MSQPTNQLRISARNAGQAELEKFCPRCGWYLLRIKKMPFQFGMPGLMFYAEAMEKAFIFAYLSKFGSVPKYFGPFADCTEPVEFPFSMVQEHKETGVLVSARADMILRKKTGNLCLLDLKTAKPEGGGKMFKPQYEIQLIGYSWVAQEAGLGKVETTGLVYCEVQDDRFKADPLKYKTDTGILVPFDFKMCEVGLDFKRLTKCLKEMNKLWMADRPPAGKDGCKDCALLTRLCDFENSLRITDAQAYAAFPGQAQWAIQQDYFRRTTRTSPESLQDLLAEDPWDQEGGMWSNWEFA